MKSQNNYLARIGVAAMCVMLAGFVRGEDPLSLEVYYASENILAKNDTASFRRITFSLYVRNVGKSPVRIATKDASWSEQIQLSKSEDCSIRAQFAPTGEPLALVETDYRCVSLEPNQLVFLHRMVDVSKLEEPFDIADYEFKYSVDAGVAHFLKIWSGSIKATKTISLKKLEKRAR
jgi:hypothetical protein